MVDTLFSLSWCISMLKWFKHSSQDDQGDFSSVNMDTAVAIRTLEATYKSSADAAAVETMILRLTEKVLALLNSAISS